MIARCFPYLLFVCAEAKTAKPHSLHIRPQQQPLILVLLLQLKVLTERTITNTWQPSSGGCPLEAIKSVFILHSWIWRCTVYTGYFLNMQKTKNPPETNHCRLHKYIKKSKISCQTPAVLNTFPSSGRAFEKCSAIWCGPSFFFLKSSGNCLCGKNSSTMENWSYCSRGWRTLPFSCLLSFLCTDWAVNVSASESSLWRRRSGQRWVRWAAIEESPRPWLPAESPQPKAPPLLLCLR